MKRITFLLFIFFLGQGLTGYGENSSDLVLSRADYQDRLRGFWFSENIANWTKFKPKGGRIKG